MRLRQKDERCGVQQKNKREEDASEYGDGSVETVGI